MALFGFLHRPAFFGGRDTTGLHTEDIDIDKWIDAHRDWRKRLTDFIQGSSQERLDEHVVFLDDRCELGKWIHGNGGKFYGDTEIFRRLKRHHADFHRSAGKVVKAFKAEGAEAAMRTLHSDFDVLSLKVIKNLETLEREIRR